MTTRPTQNPSSGSSLSTPIPTSSTTISRMLYLRSEEASNSYSPTDKTWTIPPMWTRGKYHNLVLRSFQMRHLFPNVQKTVVLSTGKKAVVFPRGNYDPCTIARYLNDQLYPDVQTVCYDPMALAFRFCPGINIVGSATTAAAMLGFQEGVDYTGATQSVLPVQLGGPRRIIIETDLRLFNIPTSGRLAVIPITQNYGEMITYENFASTHNHLAMDQDFQSIRISLTDEKGNPLEGIEGEPWDLLISFQPIDNPGFIPFVEAV